MSARLRCGNAAARRGAIVLLAMLSLIPQPVWATDGFFSRWQIRPKYKSDYRVNRTKLTWGQTLDLDRPSQRYDWRSQLYSQHTQDENVADKREAKIRGTYRLSRGTGFGEIYSDGRFQRHRNKNNRGLRAIRNDDLTIGTGIELLQREKTTLNLDMDIGLTHVQDVNQRNVGANPVVDSTDATGLTGEMLIEGAWEPSQFFSLRSTGALDRSSKNSRTVSAQTLADTTILSIEDDVDRGQNVDLMSEGRWVRYQALKTQVRAAYRDGSSQFYSAIEQAQETKTVSNQSLDITVEGDLARTLSYGVQVGLAESATEYDLQEKDITQSSSDLGLQARYEVGGVPFISGAVIRGTFGTSERRKVVENQASFDTKSRNFTMDFMRAYGSRQSQSGTAPRITISARTGVTLTQDFYEDSSQDQDRLRVEATGNARYTPADHFESSLSYSVINEDWVRIPSASSAQTQTSEDYKFTANYRMRLPRGISLRQDFQLSAKYVYYHFNEAQNKLTRTNRVTTAVKTPLWKRSALELNYIFQRNDSGAYVYSQAQGARTYSKGTGRLRQNLTVVLTYDILSWLSLEAREVLDINSRTGAAVPTEKHTFTWKANVQRRFAMGLDLNANFARTFSKVDPTYWRVRAGITKSFD